MRNEPTEGNHPQPREAWVDALRWIAAAAVVGQHALAPSAQLAILRGSPNLSWFVVALLRFAVPVFFFLSGYVNARSRRNLREKVPQAMVRTAVPLFVWSLAYSLVALAQGRLADAGLASIIGGVFVLRQAPHLWFLLSLTFVAPLGLLLRRFGGPRIYYVVLPIALVTSIVYSYSMVLHSPISSLARLLVVPLGIYMSGMWFVEILDSGVSRRLSVRVMVFVGLVFLLGGTIEAYFAELALSPRWTVVQQTYPTMVLGSILLCVGVCIWASKPTQVLPEWLAMLPRVTLGVYCLHVMTLGWVRAATGFAGSGFLPEVMRGFMCFPVSILIAVAISRIPFARRLVS